MLFNSSVFIFLYLPVVFIGTFLLGRRSHQGAALWLGLASLTFYSVWDVRFVWLLLASITFNYAAGYAIDVRRKRDASGKAPKQLLFAAIVANLMLLSYFKYTNFFIDSANLFFENRIPALDIILPLGISFFTFTQIAFLVDVHRGVAHEYNPIQYLLFVTYFPHLIAGPVLHHKQMMPQFSNPATFRVNTGHVAIGITVFVLGLAKKILLADNLGEYATPIFGSVSDGVALGLIEAWVGALSYTLQLYFDFSGYSDMAVGLSLMFNIRLPINFDSPYKSTSIIDFWRRWHMTLSTFLRDYLYIPLGGSKKGPIRRYTNLMATMLLGGLWHGAGWTFVVWGGLHGLYLMLNHGWRALKIRHGWRNGGRRAELVGGALTFLSVVIAWVFFRADTLGDAWSILGAMVGQHGLALPESARNHFEPLLESLHIHATFSGMMPAANSGTASAFGMIALGLALVWFFPNVRQMVVLYKPTCEDIEGTVTPTSKQPFRLEKYMAWQPTPARGIILAGLFVWCVDSLSKVSEFLYFRF